MKVAGLFSGCGGLDLGFKEAGFDVVWANDIDKDSCKTYEKYVSGHVVQGDITKIMHLIPEVDILIGGPPCQSFSLVGKRLENDERASLVFAYLKAVKRVKPKAFLMENVPGLASSKFNGVRLPEYLSKKFQEMSYITTLIKAKAVDFFVPQKRERLILLGIKCNAMKKEFKTIPQEKFRQIVFRDKKVESPVSSFDALDDLGNISGSLSRDSAASISYKCHAHSKYAELMRSGNEEGNVTLHVLPTMSDLDAEFVKFIPPGGNYMNIPDDIATPRIMKFKETGGRTTTYARLHPDRPSYTVNTYFNRPNVGSNYHYAANRLISPREALRLQSFPDHFTPHFTSQRSLFMQIGNAVPPLMARALAESMKEAMYV